jgi:dienelactone hydrolase
MMRALAVAALLMAGGCSQPVQLSSRGGELAAQVPGELFKPDGPGPFPAVVVLHGCNGVGPNQYTWARRLNRWGYVAIIVDSFTSRGFSDGVCGKGSLVPPDVRARDAYAAASWLRSQPFVDAKHVGVIGFSHGGWTVMHAVLEPVVRTAAATPFQAAVAYYPYCEPGLARLASDTLILIGDTDDWTPATRCTAYVTAQLDQPHSLDIKVYPGAYHAFDAPGAPRTYFGHMLGYHPSAAEDSFAMTRAFFDARLK